MATVLVRKKQKNKRMLLRFAFRFSFSMLVFFCIYSSSNNKKKNQHPHRKCFGQAKLKQSYLVVYRIKAFLFKACLQTYNVKSFRSFSLSLCAFSFCTKWKKWWNFHPPTPFNSLNNKKSVDSLWWFPYQIVLKW